MWIESALLIKYDHIGHKEESTDKLSIFQTYPASQPSWSFLNLQYAFSAYQTRHKSTRNLIF